MANTFGKLFKVTTFGESHGKALGVVIDGCPAGIRISVDKIQRDLDRRRPGQSNITSQRKEADIVEVLSGFANGVTIGSPICLLVHNRDVRSSDYSSIREAYRPSHGDFTYHKKFGVAPLSGGGRLSARETVARVAAGSIAEQLIKTINPRVDVLAFVSSIKDIECHDFSSSDLTKDIIDSSPIRCPDKKTASKMLALIEMAKKEGDSLGGCIRCFISNPPVGLGQPVFDKFEADLAKAMMSIPATKAFEIGLGFKATTLIGSQHNDPFCLEGEKIKMTKNSAGGTLGGITSGEEVKFRVGFKPTSTIFKDQKSVNIKGEEVVINPKRGRHDPCVLPRAVSIVESMTYLVLADHLLRSRIDT